MQFVTKTKSHNLRVGRSKVFVFSCILGDETCVDVTAG